MGLLDRIEEPTIHLAAPPGYGKTTLLSQWARADSRRVRWLGLDAECEPRELVRRVASALTRVVPFDTAALARASQGDDGEFPAGTDRFLDSIPGAVPFLLIIDGAHWPASGPCVEFIAAVAERVPQGSTMVLSGRRSFPAPFAALRASGVAGEMAQSDLRMTRQEVAAALRALGTDVGDDELGAIVDATGGWPAAVHLAAPVLRRGGVGADAVRDLVAERSMGDYLREVVVGPQPREVRLLLRRISVLDRVSEPLARLLVGDAAVGSRLRELPGLGVPVRDHVAQDGWLRLHPLLREVLLADLRRDDPAIERGLHLLAARWHAGEGLLDEAFAHALAAGDREGAALIYSSRVLAHLASGRRDRARARRAAFTVEDARTDPGLAIIIAWHDAIEGLADAGRFVAIAEAADPRDAVCSSDFASLNSAIAAWRAMFGSTGLDAMDAGARAFDGAEPPESAVKAWARTLVGTAALLAGRLDEAGDALRDAQVLVPPGRLVEEQFVLGMLAFRSMSLGRLAATRATVSLAGTSVPAQSTTTQASVLICAVSAAILAESGDSRGARAQLEAAMSRARITVPSPWLRVIVKLCCARACRLLGDAAGATDALGRAGAVLAEWRGAALLEAMHAEEVRALEADPPTRSTDDNEATDAVPELSAAELRVLGMLPSLRSLREIGATMFVSRNTVKTHVSAIYRVLGVSTRQDAVARARVLGLID
jgi:LuxR family maltose regulon positive regulatory protein